MTRQYHVYSWHVFVSYSHRDADIVRPLVKNLEHVLSNVNVTFFIDESDRPLEHAHGLRIGISEGLTTCQIMIAFISMNYLSSKWCMEEVKNFILLRLEELQWVSNLLKTFMQEPIHIGSTLIPVIIKGSYPIEVDKIFNQWLQTECTGLFNSPLSFIKQEIQDNKLLASAISQKLLSAFVQIEKITQALRNTGLFPKLDTPKKLWDKFWDEYPHKTIGHSINIEKVLNEFVPPRFLTTLQSIIEKNSEKFLISLFKSVASDACFTKTFDIHAAKDKRSDKLRQGLYLLGDWEGLKLSFQEKHPLIKYEDSSPKLFSFSQIGPPVAVLLANIRRRDLLNGLQYSYYRYLGLEGRNLLVDTAVLAGLFISVDIWHEVIGDEKDFIELIVTPLANGNDIASLFL